VQSLPHIVVQKVPLVYIEDHPAQLEFFQAYRFVIDMAWRVGASMGIPEFGCGGRWWHRAMNGHFKNILQLHLLMRCQEETEQNKDLLFAEKLRLV